MLTSPTLVPAESHEFIAKNWRRIALARREHLGIQGCPVGTGCDNMRRDRFLIHKLVREIFPELVAFHGEISKFVLLGEDITHVIHRFHRCVPKLSSCDSGLYKSVVKRVFLRCKVTHDPAVDPEQNFTDYLRERSLDEKETMLQVRGVLLKTLKFDKLTSDERDLMLELLPCIGERNLQKLSKAVGFHEELLRFIVHEISRNVGIDPEQETPPYHQPEDVLHEMKRVHAWFSVSRGNVTGKVIVDRLAAIWVTSCCWIDHILD